jgi:hypothetical protein
LYIAVDRDLARVPPDARLLGPDTDDQLLARSAEATVDAVGAGRDEHGGFRPPPGGEQVREHIFRALEQKLTTSSEESKESE